MRILFLVDGRSPIALNWIRYFVDTRFEVHLASMYPCQPDLNLASLTRIPAAFSGLVGSGGTGLTHGVGFKTRLLMRLATPRVRTWLRHQFVPHSLPKAARELRSLITHQQPDIIHAMRIPYEGMLASLACMDLHHPQPPLVISVWGNDFTLHAPATRRLTLLTRMALAKADALHTDCYRDLRLARAWGFNQDKPGLVLPGAGGLQLDTFYPGGVNGEPTVINPRGLRAYVRTDTFFRSIPLVLERCPGTKFICPVMAGQAVAERWVTSLGIQDSVELLPKQTRSQMASLFRRAQVVVSPSTHDGTPNTLLEAMASGCLPVVGDIESLREWITPGVNGLLVDPGDPQALAEAICSGLTNSRFRIRAQTMNMKLIEERAEYRVVMGKAAEFYNKLVNR